MKRSRSDLAFDITNTFITFIITLIMLYPLWFIIVASFSDPYLVAKGQVVFLPHGFTFEAYKNVFRNSDIWMGYKNTIFYTTVGTLYNIVLTIPAAYVLSKKRLPGHSVISWYFFITMYVSGGMIPTYIIYKNLGLLNTPFALILGPGVSCYNLIVTRQFFSSSIPDDLYEAAFLDGASHIKSFFKIALPLAAPITAVMTLFYGVSHWNSYYSALIYLTSKKYFPLQLVLRNTLILNENAIVALESTDSSDAALAIARQAYMAAAMKYALIFISSAPLLAAYPFIQKYFVKGVMIGSVKG